jgi:hypothetical protein
MAKRETKDTYQASKDLSSSVGQQYDAAITGSQGRSNTLSSDIDTQQSNLSGFYSDMMKPPTAYTPASYNAAHASAQGYTAAQADAARKIDDAALKGMQPALHNFAITGGIDPTRSADITDTAVRLKTNGGLSDENIARIRGNGGFDEFAKTGGYTPEQLANIKAQALSPIGSYATGTRDELARRSAVQGGYAPGFDAANRQLRRDTSRAIADTSLNANVALQDRINAGRQWGIGGLSGAETQIGGLRQAGLVQSGNLQANLQDLTSRYMAQGLSMEDANARAQADIDAANVANEIGINKFNVGETNQASAFGANAQNQASMFNAGADNTAGMFNTQNANQGQLFNIQNAQDQYARGVGGLQGLETQDVGRLENELDRGSGLLNARTGAQSNLLGTRAGLATQPGIGGNIMNMVGTAAGIAAPMLTAGLSRAPAGAGGGLTATNNAFQAGAGAIGPYGNYLGG